MRKPKTLKPGDRVALLAPSSPVEDEKLKLSLESIVFLGLRPVQYPTCTMRHGYLSGTDEARARDINDAFADPDIDAVFCLRGGYGATRILPLLDYKTILENPKVFLGYSDITVFHLAINQICDLATLHSPMPTRGWATLDYLSLNSLTANLFGGKAAGAVPVPVERPITTLAPGTGSGKMTGGNLSLLAATLGSPYEVDTRGKILFIEDVDEEPYKIDRALTALSLAGKFRDCVGIVLGIFAGCEPPLSADASSVKTKTSLTLSQIFQEVVIPAGKPVVNWFPAGHVYPHVAIPMGVEARLEASESPTLSFLEPFTC